MKKLPITIFLLFVLIIVLSDSASAKVMYYTYEGKVNHVYKGDGLNRWGKDINIGDIMNYTMAVDFEESAYIYSPSSGSKNYFPPTGAPQYFATWYVGGYALLGEDSSGLQTRRGQFNDEGTSVQLMYLSNAGHIIITGSVDQMLTIGGTVTALESPYYYVDGVYSGTNTHGRVTLTAISETNPYAAATPIPGAVWLFGSGAMALIGLRKKCLSRVSKETACTSA